MGRRARLKKARKEFAAALRREHERPVPQTLQEAILYYLTGGGSFPIDYCFLLGDQQLLWDPARGELVYLYVLDGDPDFHAACHDYLRQIGSAFRTVEEVEEEVGRRGLRKVRDD